MAGKFEITNINKEEITTLNDAFAVKAVSEDNSEIRYTTTFDEDMLFNAIRGKSEPVSDYIGETVTVTDIVVSASDMAVDVNNPDGEKENHPIIHFFLDDGRHLSTASNGIRRNVKALFEIGKVPTPETPITITFDEVNTKRGKAHTFSLVKKA